MKEKADIGLIGLAVMGENLVLNMENHGYTVAVFNRTVEKVDRFVNGRGKGKNFIGAHSLQELVDSIERPRKVMMLIKAGTAVDSMIDQLIPLLDKGDIIIDGGNSNYNDTIRRTGYVESKGLLYIGTGVSGGEEGALKGPSMMPGGSVKAWPYVKDIFQTISAKSRDGEPCCDWVGKEGAGHYVKMIHNGIEYGDMELICEAYQLMRDYLGMSNEEMHEVFAQWNTTELDSYLIEITSKILNFKDDEGKYVVDYILDVAGQKGTGKWTGINSLEEGIPLSLIVESVFARCISSLKDQRVVANGIYKPAVRKFSGTEGEKKAFIDKIRKALFASKVISYAQGFALIKTTSEKMGWNINYGQVAMMWRGGCIIRSVFLGRIRDAFSKNPDLDNILLDDYFVSKIEECLDSWRDVVSESFRIGVPVPAFSAALSYFDGYTTANLPQNLLQAQRDFFGAHTYEKVGGERGVFYHTAWNGDTGSSASSSYTV